MELTWERFLDNIIDKKMRLCPYIMEEEPQCNGAILWRVPKPSDSESILSLIKALHAVSDNWTLAGFPIEITTRAKDFEISYHWRFEYEDNLYDATEID